jgi:hypothetical protein
MPLATTPQHKIVSLDPLKARIELIGDYKDLHGIAEFIKRTNTSPEPPAV